MVVLKLLTIRMREAF